MRSLRLLRAGIALIAIVATRPVPVWGQDERETYISVAPQTGAVQVEVGRLLADRSLEEAVYEGLPLRIRVDVELWSDGFFDSEVGSEEWRASIVYDPVTLDYQVRAGNGEAREFGTLSAARAHLESTFGLDLRPRRPGRYYYLAVVELETLSRSDFDELRRWLDGDLRPAVGGDTDVEGALTQGVRRLFVRALGLPARRIRLRTEAFTFEGEPQ
ncbi:MAG: DUF4390 domain-containing protein [Gemmatimonadetes bacterium]|nr:DUF4390 domain-containing protein [Gemmatimonadota bacterium]NNK64125.1 DUF4390 domain-containing protein [Gemmatimonadota bacterium]